MLNQYSYFKVFIWCLAVQLLLSMTEAKICTQLNGVRVNIEDFVGSWMTVYAQPKMIDCYKFYVRAITELEREQYTLKFGNFSGEVSWDMCYLQVVVASGGLRHFLFDDGTHSGVMKNVIINEDLKGKYSLQNITADKWIIYGRRGTEVLLIRDCLGQTAAAFARVPYWPNSIEMSAIFHRSGVIAQTYGQQFCKPEEAHRLLHTITVPQHTNDNIKESNKILFK